MNYLDLLKFTLILHVFLNTEISHYVWPDFFLKRNIIYKEYVKPKKSGTFFTLVICQHLILYLVVSNCSLKMYQA